MNLRSCASGKTFEATTPIGPVLVTPDEVPGGVRPALAMTGQMLTTDIEGIGVLQNVAHRP